MKSEIKAEVFKDFTFQQMEVPESINGKINKENYNKWLVRKAKQLSNVDKKQKIKASTEIYLLKIHDAVKKSKGYDHYTNELLDWELISEYDVSKAELLGNIYLHRFVKLPTVRHEINDKKVAVFFICGWRTNDCINNLTHEEIIRFSEMIIANAKKK